MKVVGLERLARFSARHANAKRALDFWLLVVGRERWRNPHDIKARYSSADFLSANRVIFNIKGNHYRLVTGINYEIGAVAIEWVGTHAEYDKQKFQ